MRTKIFIKINTDFDKQQIRLWQNNLKNIDASRHNWFYNQNLDGKPITVLSTDDDGKLVGNCSLYGRKLWVGNTIYKMGIAADFAVDPKQRVFGPALKMQRRLVEEADIENYDLLFAFPNNNGRALFQRIGYKKLGAVSQAVKILKSRVFISKIIKVPVLPTVMGFIIDSAISLFDYLQYICDSRRYSYSIGYMNDDYDTLWNMAKSDFPIIPEKSSKYFLWRYVNNPSKNYEFFNLFDSEGLLAGVIIYSLEEKNIMIEDLFLKNPAHNLDLILMMFIKEMRQQGMYRIAYTFLGNPLIKQSSKKLKFRIKDDDRFCFVRISDNIIHHKELLLSPANWFLFESEMDL